MVQGNLEHVMIHRRAHLARFGLDPLAVPRRYSEPWAVRCPCTGAGEAETANESAPRRGVLGSPVPSPSYRLLRAPNVRAFTINLHKQYYRLFFFSFFFVQGNQRLGLYKSTQDLNEIPRCINRTVSQCRSSPNSLFCGDSSRRSPKRRPFTVGVCPLHDLTKTNPPQAARAESLRERAPASMTPPRGHGPGAGRGGRDRSGQSGRAGSGWMRALFPTPASGPGHRRVWRRKLQRQRESAASPGRPGRNRRETGTAKSRRMGRTALPWDSFPGCQDGPIWFPVRSQIYLQAEKSTLVFLGNSFRCVPVGVSF